MPYTKRFQMNANAIGKRSKNENCSRSRAAVSLVLLAMLLRGRSAEGAPEHTFVRIDLAATETALVKFFALKPDDQTGQLYVDVYTVDTITTIEGPAKTTAFTGEPGTYTVDVFGNNTAESFTCRIIAKKPQPIPIPNPQPKPDDNVTPQPTPTPVVVPDAVLNKLGIGEVAYREALNIGDKAKVAGMATYVGKLKNQVRSTGLTPRQQKPLCAASKDSKTGQTLASRKRKRSRTGATAAAVLSVGQTISGRWNRGYWRRRSDRRSDGQLSCSRSMDASS